MRATQKQIAEMSGVHPSTVDKVVNGREGVSDEVRARVQKIIDELNYKPNAIGKALAQQKNPKTIAVLLLRVDATKEIQEGIEAAYSDLKNFAIKLEYFISEASDPTEQLITLKMLQSKKIHGLIIAPIQTPEIVAEVNLLVDKEIPVVTVNTDIPESKRICFVGQDAIRAGRVAGELMGEILNGQGQLAVIAGTSQMLNPINRQIGFTEAITEAYPNIKIVETVETNEQAIVAFKKTVELLNEYPDLSGLFVTCGNVSEVGRAVRMLNKDKKIKIISFDLYPEIIKLVEEKIINFTIGQNLHQQGFRSFKTIFDIVFHANQPESSFIGTTIDIRLKGNIHVN